MQTLKPSVREPSTPASHCASINVELLCDHAVVPTLRDAENDPRSPREGLSRLPPTNVRLEHFSLFAG